MLYFFGMSTDPLFTKLRLCFSQTSDTDELREVIITIFDQWEEQGASPSDLAILALKIMYFVKKTSPDLQGKSLEEVFAFAGTTEQVSTFVTQYFRDKQWIDEDGWLTEKGEEVYRDPLYS